MLLSVGLISGLVFGLIGVLVGGLIFGLVFGLIGGPVFVLLVLFGLLLGEVKPRGAITAEEGVGSLNRITLVETMSWKWNKFFKRTIQGSIFGLFLGLFGLREGLAFGLFLGLLFGLASGLTGGWTDMVRVGKAYPNQGIKLSGKNSLASFLVTLAVGGLIYGMISLIGEPSHAVRRGLWFFGAIGVIVVLNRGGSAVIKHYALRLTLWLNGYTPFKFVNFLDHCAQLILLKKVGGGYIFIHRLLLEYFAELAPQSTKGN